MNTSTPRLRIARLTSPRLGSNANMSRNSGCARTILGSPSEPWPHSETSSDPPVSNSGLSLSRTVGEHRLAFSRSTHSPSVAALSKTPSTHSNRPALGAAPPHASGPNVDSRSRMDETTGSSLSFNTSPSPTSPSTSMASRIVPPSVASRLAAKARASATASTTALSASLAEAASSARAPRLAASTMDSYADHFDQARSTTSSRNSRFLSLFSSSPSSLPSSEDANPANEPSASAATRRSVVDTTSSSAARSRAGSFCSNEPRSSDVSVAAVSATLRSVRPARSARHCATLVLPLAGGPTRMVIHPRDAQCAAASSAPVWPRSTETTDAFPFLTARETPTPAREVASAAPPTRSAPSSSKVTATGDVREKELKDGPSSKTPANAEPNRRAHSRRSLATRRRRTKIVSCVSRNASATLCTGKESPTRSSFDERRVIDVSSRLSLSHASSHHLSTSRRLNSQGAPARAKLPPGARAASASDTTKLTAFSTKSAGTAGYSEATMWVMSCFSMGSTCTRVNRLRNDFGNPFLPPPSCTGFCAAKTRNVGGHRKVSPSSGTKISARWSNAAFKPSNTGCGAKLSSSKRTQSPRFKALKNAPSAHRNSPASPPSFGKSAPSKSIMSVCSLRLTRVRRCPAAFARALIKEVLPTPGEPSSKMGFGNCIARNTRAALRFAEGAFSSNCASTAPTAPRGSDPRGTANGATPKRFAASSSTNAPSSSRGRSTFFVAPRFSFARFSFGGPKVDAAPEKPPGFEAASIA